MDDSLEDRRTINRKHVAYYTRVFNAESKDQLGSLGDITTGGFMLISEHPIEVPKTYRVQIELSSDVAEKGYIEFLATSLWSKPDVEPSYFNTGFKAAKISTEDKAIIKRILNLYGIRDN